MMKKAVFILKFVFVVLTLIVIWHVLFVTEQYWSGVYYPNGNTSGNAVYSPRFTSKEECIGWAINERGLRHEDVKISLGDLWECNKNCRLYSGYSTLLNATQEYKQELLDGNRGPLYVCDDGGFDGADWLRGDY